MKKILAVIMSVCMLALCGCSPSETAMTVNGRAVDAAEFAFYLQYNRLYASDETYKYSKPEVEAAREASINQIITNELVLEKCKEKKLKLSAEQKDMLDENKDQLIESLGGMAAYRKYLKQSSLTDRGYDKFQENSIYYTMLHDYEAEKGGVSEYTSEQMRKYFAENFIKIKYIRFSTVNEDGSPVSETDDAAIFDKASLIYSEITPETDFDALIAQYNDDAMMSSGDGEVVSSVESENNPYYKRAFELADKQIDGVIKGTDGYYIVQRLPAPADYYEPNEEYIKQSANDWYFAQQLAQWREKADVSIKSIVNDINLENYNNYIK